MAEKHRTVAPKRRKTHLDSGLKLINKHATSVAVEMSSGFIFFLVSDLAQWRIHRVMHSSLFSSKIWNIFIGLKSYYVSGHYYSKCVIQVLISNV